MKDIAKMAADLAGDPAVEADVLREHIKWLHELIRVKDEALRACQNFLPSVGPNEDGEELGAEIMHTIEQLEGQVSSALDPAYLATL